MCVRGRIEITVLAVVSEGVLPWDACPYQQDPISDATWVKEPSWTVAAAPTTVAKDRHSPTLDI